MQKIGEGKIRSDYYLKTLFENGDKPTEDDFADLIESKAHKKDVFLKSDEVSCEDIDLLLESLNNFYKDDNTTFIMKDSKTSYNAECSSSTINTKSNNLTSFSNKNLKEPKHSNFKKKYNNIPTKKIKARIKK